MERIKVKSSNIVSIGYNINEELLEIEFKGNRIYHYKDVPEYLYQDLINAESIGKFFNSNIKDQFTTEKVE